MFVFDSSDLPTIDIPIVVGNDPFTIRLNQPSLDDLIVDEAFAHAATQPGVSQQALAFKARYAHRLASVIGWDGINDAAGTPVAFSTERLVLLLGKYPEIMGQLAEHLSRLYSTDDPVPVQA